MTFADVKPGRRIRAGHILELQDMVGGFQDQLDAIPEAEDLVDMQADIDGLKDGTVPVPLAGIADALGAYEPLGTGAGTLPEIAERVSPATDPTSVGQIIANTPSGRIWHEGPISADWYSDINDAITAARQGVRGVRPIILSKDTDYDRTGMDPIMLYSGLSIIGDSSPSSRILTTTADATLMQVASSALCDRPILRDFRVYGGNTASVGLDWRGITRGMVSNVEVSGFTETQLWVGGDYPTYNAGWSNNFERMRITAPTNGSGIRLSGLYGAVSTANRNRFEGMLVKGVDSATSICVDLQAGDTNQFIGGDYGYGAASTIFKLSTGAYQNVFAFGASEDCAVGLDNYGSRNSFIAWGFPATSSQVIRSGATYTQFISCPELAITDEDAANNRTVVVGITPSQFPAISTRTNSGSVAVKVYRVGENYERVNVRDSGEIRWTVPSTGVGFGGITPQASTSLLWNDDTLLRMPRTSTTLPAASVGKRGAVMRLEGGTGVADKIYTCIKDATDAYVWKEITLA